MKLPARLTLALGTLIAGGAAITRELHLATPVQKLILLVAGVVLFLLRPPGTPSPEQAALMPTSAVTPDGAAPIPPPGASA